MRHRYVQTDYNATIVTKAGEHQLAQSVKFGEPSWIATYDLTLNMHFTKL